MQEGNELAMYEIFHQNQIISDVKVLASLLTSAPSL